MWQLTHHHIFTRLETAQQKEMEISQDVGIEDISILLAVKVLCDYKSLRSIFSDLLFCSYYFLLFCLSRIEMLFLLHFYPNNIDICLTVL